MAKHTNKTSVVLLAALLVLSLANLGCGRNPASDTGIVDDQSSSSTDFNNDPSYVTPVVTPTVDPNYGNLPVNALTANVMSKDTSGIWLWKKAKGTIMVTNASQYQASGTLNISFTYNGATAETQQQMVSLAAGESKQIEVKATKKSDDVMATITPDSSTGTGYNTSYGTDNGYSNGTSYSSY